VLEQVRLLTNLETDDRKLLRIILIGQPELKEMLERQDLRQLAQRITARYHLGSLNREDTYAYIMHRMSRAGGNPHAFSSAALRRIYSLSKGTPRLINVIADRALLGAYTLGRHQVTARIVNRAAREVLGQKPDRRAWWIGAATALLAAGAAWAILVPFGGKLPIEQAVTDRGTAAEPATVEQAMPASANTAADRDAAAEPTPGLANEQTGQTAGVAAAPVAQQGARLVDPAEEAPAEALTPEGEEIITPETYAQMQADARNQAGAGPSLNPQSVPAAASARSTSTISRPAGGHFRNQRLAYAAVFERWGVSYDDLSSDQIPCDFAPSAGLQCLTERGDWSQIAQMDLPVVLELWDGRPDPFHAALLGMEDGRILLGIGNETVETTQRALRDQWAGSYVVLWQTPPSYYGSLRSGQRHETVGWLRLQLGSLLDRSLASPMPNLFDENLERAVRKFQSAEGLTADGIVGPATWIRLATRLNLPQPSLAG
jgi:general secretion pathway protein A